MRAKPQKRAPFTVVDIFAGVGGFSLGFINAKDADGSPSFDVRLLVDCDREAAYTFKKNHPSIPYLVKDIRQVSAKEVFRHAGTDSLDVLIGGPPCQGFSSAGKRLFEDERNALLKDYVRLVAELKPAIALMENVPSLLGSFHGAYAAELVETLSSSGYDAHGEIIRASDFGVPQSRRRAFVLAIRKDFRVKHPGFPIPNGFRSNPVNVEQAIGDLPALRAGGGEDPAYYSTPPNTIYQRKMRKGSFALFNHLARKHADWFLEKIAIIPEGGGNRDLEPDLQFSENYFSQAYARLSRNETAHTITTNFLNPGSGRFIHYRDLRSITAREAARLQSFDDNFIFHGHLSAMERHIGNAVPPILAEVLASHVEEFLSSVSPNNGARIQRQKQ